MLVVTQMFQGCMDNSFCIENDGLHVYKKVVNDAYLIY